MVGSSLFSILVHVGYKLENIALGLLSTAIFSLALPAFFSVCCESTLLLTHNSISLFLAFFDRIPQLSSLAFWFSRHAVDCTSPAWGLCEENTSPKTRELL